MAATTIHSLLYKVTADSSGFTSGMKATRTELSAAKKLMAETATPAEKLGRSVEALNKLHAKGAIDSATHARALFKLKKEYDDVANSAHKAGKEIAVAQGPGLGAAALSGAAPRLALLATPAGAAAAAGAAGVAGLAAVGTAMAAAGVQGVKLAADFETTEVAFKTMLGSAEAAKDVLGDLTEFAAATPFEFPELADSTRKLIAFGVAQDELIPTLGRIGDISAGLSIPIGELAELYGKARVQGRLFAQDVNQLTGRGIPVIQEFAKQFGVADSEVRKLVESGEIGFENLEQAFISLTSEGGKFQGLMEAQSQTMHGLSSTLSDEFNLALRDLGMILASELDLKGLLKDMIELAKVFKEDGVPAVREFISVAKEMATVLAEIDDAIGGPISETKEWFDTLVAARQVLVEVVGLYGQLTGNATLQSAAEMQLKKMRGELAKPPLAQIGIDELPEFEGVFKGEGAAAGVGAGDAASEERKLVDEADKLGDALIEQIRLLQGISKEEQHINELREKGVNVDRLTTLQKDLELVRARKEAEKDEEKAEKAEQQRQEALSKEAGRFLEMIKSPGEKLGEALFRSEELMLADHLTIPESMAVDQKLTEDFKKQFKGQRAPSRTAGAALERGSAEAFSATMRSADRQANKLEKLPDIAEKELQVARETLEELRKRPPVQFAFVE